MSVAFEIEVVPTGTVGAEMRGVDLASVNEAQVEAIKRAWYRHDVLVFRNQEMTDDDLLAFSRHFGALDPPPNQGAGRKSPPGYPEVYVVSNVLDRKGEPIGALGDGDAAWHTDMSYVAQPPDASNRECLARLGLDHPTTFAERAYRALVNAALVRSRVS